MRKTPWVGIFFLILAAHIAGILLHNETVQLITKPLIVIALALYFITATSAHSSGAKKKVMAALFFSWLGDVLLMFQQRNDIFFLLGLSSFLLAHIMYISFFHSIRVKENIQSRGWLLPIVAAYYAALITLIYSHLGGMEIPVLIYGLVISFMLLLALHLSFMKNKAAGRLMAAGAVFFILSDSVLAINKFYEPFAAAGWIVMLTYGLAQWLIIRGAGQSIVNSQ